MVYRYSLTLITLYHIIIMEVLAVPEEIKLQIPVKIAEFIDKLTKDGYFNSREDFVRCSVEIVAQLYGLSKTSKGGKALLDVLADNEQTKPAKKVEATKRTTPITPKPLPKKKSSELLSADDCDVIDLFAGMKFEFEDALHARYTMELMKQAKAPIPKEQFLGILAKLQANGNIEKSEHNKKVVWKLIEGY